MKTTANMMVPPQQPPPQPPPPDNPLPYAAGSARRRKWIRRALFWTLLSVVVLVLLRWGYLPVRDKATFLHHQRRCMTFGAAADTIAYTEDPATIARLAGGALSGPGWATLGHKGKPVAYYLVPPSLRTLEQTPNVDLTQGLGPVFLHARTAPGGGERLVVVKVDSFRGYGALPGGSPLPNRMFDVGVMQPASVRAGPTVTKSLWKPTPKPPAFGELTFFAGQPDRNDPSHFTIEYRTPTARGTIDGWLQPDDTVRFSVRDGPLARVGSPEAR